MKRSADKSFFIIKPEGFSYRDQIKRMITEEANMVIEATKTVVLTPEDIDILYQDDRNTDLIKLIKARLVGRKVEAGIVTGRQAHKRLGAICGANYIPMDNPVGTIRRKFGKEKPIILNGHEYYLNAIHKASDTEVIPSLCWFMKIKTGR